MNTTRRNFFQSTAAAAALTTILPFINSSKTLAKSVKSKIQITGNPLRIPPQWKGATLMVSQGNQQLWQGNKTRTYTLGSYPGMTIKKKKGDMFQLAAHNMLNEDFAIHWHGFDVPADMDGHPKDAFPPNDLHAYKFQIKQRTGTYFYHSHAHLRTGEHVHKGMFGAFIVEDDEEKALGLPSEACDVILAIQDVQVDSSNQLIYDPQHLDKMAGWLGNTILVNGTPDAYLSVSQDYYRLRIINASNARVYNLAYENNQQFYVIASDGGLLEAPVPLTSLMIGPAERYEILFDFSKLNIGDSIILKSNSFLFPPGVHGDPVYPQGMEFNLIRFDVDTEQQSSFTLPAQLSTIERYNEADAKNVRKFEIEMVLSMQMKHTINGVLFEMGRINENIPLGQLEIWEFINKDEDMVHPMHTHGAQFQILSRNGNSQIPEYERGWKDTFLLGNGETVRLLIKYTDYEGVYLVHCHNLEHEDDGMMINTEVKSTSGVSDNILLMQKYEVYPNPAQDYINIYCNDTMPAYDVSVSLIDNLGRIVLKQRFAQNSGIITMKLDNIQSGSYIVNLENGKENYSLPLAVFK